MQDMLKQYEMVPLALVFRPPPDNTGKAKIHEAIDETRE